jgi:hypothetical protein
MATATERKINQLLRANAQKVSVAGARDAWQVGSKLIWIIEGQSKVLVGYANNPQAQGVLMSLKTAINA